MNAAAFLLGKPLRRDAVLADVAARLRARSIAVTVYVASGDGLLAPSLESAALIVQRGLRLPDLNAALRLERAGVRCCNRIASTIAVRNRELTMQTLALAGVPVPDTVSAASWVEIADLAAHKPVVVKAADEVVGRGLGVLKVDAGSVPPHPPFTGPYIVQEYVQSKQGDHKVYVAGTEASGLVKGSSLLTEGQRVQPFAVDTELTNLSRRVGTALDLEIYGVDFVYGARGPVVVDVNPFPGFRGVAKAAPSIARYLTAIAVRLSATRRPHS